MKAVVLLVLLGVAAAHPASTGPKDTTKGEDYERTPGAFAYHYPVFGGFPVYHSNTPYAFPYTFPFVVASPAHTKETVREAKALGQSSTGSTGSKPSGSSGPRAKRSAYPDPEADKQTFYASFPFPHTTTYKFPAATYNIPTGTTYNIPAATFPFASPYTHAFPYTFPFVVASPAHAKETVREAKALGQSSTGQDLHRY